MSGEMKSLTIWVKCPMVKPSHRSIEYCFKCDYKAAILGDQLKCVYEVK